MSRRYRAAVAGVIAVLVVSAPAAAVNYFRIGSGGDFRAPQLWSPWNPLNPGQFQGPGGANDTANFNLGVAPANRYTLTNVHGTNERFLVHNDSVTFNLSDAYSLVGTSSPDASFVVGTTSGGTGDVIFTGSGTLHSQHNIIGDVAGSSGVVRVVGVDWTINTGILRVGNFGSGSLLIQNGGTVSNVGVAAISGNIGGSAGSIGSVTVTGANSTWTNNGVLNVGVSGTGSMNVSGGGRVVNGIGNIGASSAGQGFVSVSGNNSTWINNGELRVGASGVGTLNVVFGGGVESTAGLIGQGSGSSGTVTVQGAGSVWSTTQTLTIGQSGTGTLNIENGGMVSNTWGNVGLNAGSSGTVTVSGAGSIWTNEAMLVVAERGEGTLTISGGGSVSSEPGIGTTAGVVGWLSGSSGAVTVDGAGSTWNNNGGMVIGAVGSGTLTIQNGGWVSSSSGALATAAGSSGTVTVSGAGSTWDVSGNLMVGGDFAPGGGAAVLNVQDHALVSSAAGFIANDDGSTGTVTIESNAAWIISGDLTVGGQVGGGGAAALHIQNGGSVGVGMSGGGDIAGNTSSKINLDSGGVLDVRGTINMNGGAFSFLGGTLHAQTFTGSLVNEGGTLAPGNPVQLTGTTTISANYTQQAAGALEIEIGGVVPGQFDAVAVAGNANLAGTLRLSLVDGFVPLQGNSFTILETEFGGIGGKFSQVEGSLPLPGMGLAVTYGTDFVRVQTAIPGDANLDGAVTIADLGILAANWQQSDKTWAEADFNGDGQVTIADLGILAAHWQMGAGGFSHGSAVGFEEALGMFDVFNGVVVPEPGSGLLLVITAGMARRRVRQREVSEGGSI